MLLKVFPQEEINKYKEIRADIFDAVFVEAPPSKWMKYNGDTFVFGKVPVSVDPYHETITFPIALHTYYYVGEECSVDFKESIPGTIKAGIIDDTSKYRIISMSFVRNEKEFIVFNRYPQKKEPNHVERLIALAKEASTFRNDTKIVDALRKAIIPAFDMIDSMDSDEARTEVIESICNCILTSINNAESYIGSNGNHEYAECMRAWALCASMLGNQLEARVIGRYPQYKNHMLTAWKTSLRINQNIIRLPAYYMNEIINKSISYTSGQIRRYDFIPNTITPVSNPIAQGGLANNPQLTSIVAYLSLIGLMIAYFIGDRENAKVHLNNSLILVLAGFIFDILIKIEIFKSIALLFGVLIMGFWCVGMIWAIKGEQKELPLVGQLKIIR